MRDPSEKWHSDHAIKLRNFLESETGQLTLDILRFLKPAYSLNNDPYSIARSHGAQEGYENYPNNLWLLTRPEFLEPPESDRTQYPDLNDDTKWNDSNPKQT